MSHGDRVVLISATAWRLRVYEVLSFMRCGIMDLIELMAHAIERGTAGIDAMEM